MSLFNEIKTTLNKEGIAGTKEYQDSYETGINVFNWRNRQFDPMSPTKYAGPISAGTLNTFIGRSGSGKTTAAIRIATNIAEQFEESNVIHFDFEHSSNIARVRALSGWNEEKFNKKYLFLNSGITAESFYQTCRAIAKIKTDKRKELEYDTGVVDSEGNKIMELPPTIIILDSIAAMFSNTNAEEEEMGGTMSATQQARTNNQVIKRLTGASVLSDGNLIILAINHVTSKIQINAFQQTSSDINYLAADESLPGRCPAWGNGNVA